MKPMTLNQADMMLDLRIEDDAWGTAVDAEALCLRALGAAAEVGKIAGEVAVLLTDDTELHALNKTWRGKDKPTDVLSFPAGPEDAPFLGDIAIAFGVASRDAVEQGKPLHDHLAHLLVHGYLHLVGHDHMNDTDAHEMEALERAALASIGLPDPYSQRT